MELNLYRCSDGDFILREWSPIRVYDIQINEMAVSYIEGYLLEIESPWKLLTISNLKPTTFKVQMLAYNDTTIIGVKEFWDFNRSCFIYFIKLEIKNKNVFCYDGTIEEAINEHKGKEL
jgi:hypothetical protein